MYKESQIDIAINRSVYERILNNIRTKAPVEIGVEVAVYMIMFGLIEDTNYIVADVNSMWKSTANVYSISEDTKNFGAVPDLVIVRKDFNFGGNDKDDIKGANGFIEVKSLATNYNETAEITSHKNNTHHFIWTNGIDWIYFHNLKEIWNIKLGENKSGSVLIDGLKFNELLYRLNSIDWSEDN